jgi:hypothetical protein
VADHNVAKLYLVDKPVIESGAGAFRGGSQSSKPYLVDKTVTLHFEKSPVE